MSLEENIEKVEILGLPLHLVGVEELHAYIDSVIQRGGQEMILNLNIHGANLAMKHDWFRTCLRQAGLVFCDGDGIRWGLELLGKKAPPKITYDRWVWQLSEFCTTRSYRLFFLGSKPGVAETAASKLREKYPQVEIVGAQHGYFEKEGPENERIIEQINQTNPDILLVGFGMPIQEKWIAENRDKINVRIFLAGGAALECISGTLTKPPQWMIQLQLEWLYQWCQQPIRRFSRYAFGIPYFFYHILKERFFKRV